MVLDEKRGHVRLNPERCVLSDNVAFHCSLPAKVIYRQSQNGSHFSCHINLFLYTTEEFLVEMECKEMLFLGWIESMNGV